MEQTSILPVSFEGLTKSQISERAELVVTSLLESGNVFEVVEALSAMEEFQKSVRKDARFVEYVREELLKNNGKLSTASGAKIEICESGVKYDYSKNQDWVLLSDTIDKLNVTKKEIEDKLKKIPAGRVLVDEESGELLEGPVKTSTSTYKITLAK